MPRKLSNLWAKLAPNHWGLLVCAGLTQIGLKARQQKKENINAQLQHKATTKIDPNGTHAKIKQRAYGLENKRKKTIQTHSYKQKQHMTPLKIFSIKKKQQHLY